MSEKPTMETDAAAASLEDMPMTAQAAGFCTLARRLERERDEAMEARS